MISINPNINFTKKNKYALVFSIILVLVSTISIFSNGLNLGIDFTKGTRFDFETNNSLTEIKNAINKTQIKDNYLIKKVENINDKSDYKNVFSLTSKIDFEPKDIRGIDYNELLFEGISKSVSDNLKYDAIWSMSIAVILILIYVTIRFNPFFALGSILALVHDILITIGIFSLFQLEINLPIIAAFLTILGYSLNDTIVVYDRIRENIKLSNYPDDISELTNKSINQTISRTILTSLTTLIVLIVLFFVGNYLIKLFTLALIIGVLIGTYSSIFVASYCVNLLQNKFGYVLKKFNFEEEE